MSPKKSRQSLHKIYLYPQNDLWEESQNLFQSKDPLVLSPLFFQRISQSPCQNTEAIVQRYSVKKVTLKISQNPQENTCARVSFLKLVSAIFIKILFFHQMIAL